jgi:hypothetical protein
VKGQIAFRATEAWTDTATGTDIAFLTTSPGTSALVERWKIGDAGNFLPNGPYDIGAAAGRVRSVFGTTGDFSGNISASSIFAAGQLYGNIFAQIVNYGSNPAFSCVRGNGSEAAPTPVKQFDWLATFSGTGRAATKWTGATGAIVVAAKEDFTDTANGSAVDIYTTPFGSTILTARWEFAANGELFPITSNAYDIGLSSARVRSLYAGTVDLAGPNAILILAGRTGAGLWGLYSSNGTSLQFWNGTMDVAALSSTGALTLNGGLSANGNVSATGTIQAPVVSGGPSGFMAMSGTAGVNTVLYFDVVTPSKPAYFAYDLVGNYLDLSLGGVHVAQFTPDEKSLILVGPVRSSAFIVTPPAGNGYITLNPGSPNNSGFVGFFDPANTRVGYLGFAYTTNKLIVLAAEAGYSYQFGQSFSTQGEMFFGAASDVPEPRGRYWGRPAPSGNYTLALVDAGSFVVQVAAAPNTITIPPQSAVAWKSWTRIDFVQYGPGQITFAPGVGVTLNATGGKRKTTGPLSVASLIQINPDEWLLVGDLTL